VAATVESICWSLPREADADLESAAGDVSVPDERARSGRRALDAFYVCADIALSLDGVCTGVDAVDAALGAAVRERGRAKRALERAKRAHRAWRS
jgi:hypothetical protein